MGDLIPKNTDDEMERYNEADMVRRARIPMENNAALVYEVDPVSKREVALFPLSSGGYVKIGERAVTPAQAAQTDVLAAQATVQNDGRTPIGMVLGEMATGPNAEGVRIDPTMEDYASAGYTEAEVIEYQNQKAVSPTTQFAVQLAPEQVQMGVDVGAPMATTRDATRREGATEFLSGAGDGAASQFLREVYEAIGLDEFEARRLAEAVIGNPNSTRDFGFGLADLTPAGIIFGAEEGYNTFQRGLSTDDPLTAGLGALEAGLSVLEAAPMVGAGVRGLRELATPAMREAINTLRADAIGAGRAVMQGDTEMLGEVFQPAGTARSLGAAAPDPNAAGAGAAGAGAAGAETTALARNTMEPRQVEVPTDERRGMIAFHGSGADFDRFELNKIGTGEKAQVFGRGLYFTDSEDIAEFYRQSVRGRQDLSLGYEVSYKGNKVVDLGDTPSAELQPYENAAVNKIADNISRVTTMATRDLPQSELVQLAKDKAIKTLEGEIKRTAERTSGSMFDELTELIGNSLNDELKALRAINPNDVSFAEGKKYQVRLDVSPEELLNWDVPFDKQTPAAQRAIMKTADEITLDDAMNLGVDVFDAPYNGDEAAALDAAKKILLDDFSVNRFLNTWSDIRGSDGVGEELLAKNGLKGITYKADQGPTARDPSASGPSNYVIFDDKLINIMKKYGIVGPVAVTGIASQEETSNEI